MEGGYGLRKRKVAATPLDTGKLLRQAAAEVVQGMHGGSCRRAADHHGLESHSGIQYHVNRWRKSELGELVAELPPTNDSSPTSDVSEPALLQDMPPEVSCTSRFAIKQWMAKQAAQLVSLGECSTRAASEMVNGRYAPANTDGKRTMPTVSHSTVRNYIDDTYAPESNGRKTNLPSEFTDKLVAWIRGRRALKFPVFRDDVLAVANRLLLGNPLLATFKHHALDSAWYYRMLSNYSHVLDTANQRTLEIDRAKWCTAKNVLEWYTMLATAFVELNVAVKNPDFDSNANPQTHAGQPILITKPGRIISFDETRVEMDMTKASKSKKERTIVDKKAPQIDRQDSLAAKGGISGTGVGGSTANGRTLPALFIFSGGGLKPEHCTPSPDSGFIDDSGRMHQAKFTANQKGGVDSDVAVQYMRDVIVPAFAPSEADPIVIICDGHGSHLTLQLLEYCRAHHVHILLRVPHTSHRTQGEDVSAFAKFKPELRRQRIRVLTSNVERHGFYGLKSTDFMKCVAPAWNYAFQTVSNMKGWAVTGIYPFTRQVYYELKESEACATTVASSSMINYTPLQSLTGLHTTVEGDSSDGEGDEEEAAVRRGRLTSAQIYALGPVTHDQAFNIVKDRVETKRQATELTKARKELRASKIDEKLQALRASVSAYPDYPSIRCIKSLTIQDLKGYLLRDAGHRWDSEYSKLKTKSSLVDAVCALFPPIPAVELVPSSPPLGNTPPSPSY